MRDSSEANVEKGAGTVCNYVQAVECGLKNALYGWSAYVLILGGADLGGVGKTVQNSWQTAVKHSTSCLAESLTIPSSRIWLTLYPGFLLRYDYCAL
jgi:hypothetical protein